MSNTATREMFTLRGDVPKMQARILFMIGITLFFLVWAVLPSLSLVKTTTLPGFMEVLGTYPEMISRNRLLNNFAYSLMLNLGAYIVAVAISVPVGFAIGLFPGFNILFARPLVAFRYLPLNIFLGLFIAWYGISSNMKVRFLAVGIMVYFIPAVANRVFEVEQKYDQVLRTYVATNWQRIKRVFIPASMDRIYDDAVGLLPLSWTYILIAEAINTTDGGIGALAIMFGRQSKTPQVFAIALLILATGIIFDLIWLGGRRMLFPHRHK